MTSACGVMGTEDESLDYESKVLSQFSHAQQHLLFTYTTLSALNSNGAVTIDEDGTEVVCVNNFHCSDFLLCCTQSGSFIVK